MQLHVWRPQYRSGCRRIIALFALLGGAGLVPWVVSSAAASLPDGRAYELVSPPDMAGTSVLPIVDTSDTGLPQRWNAVAADGDGVLWRVVTAPPGAPDSSGFMDVYRSVRGATAGWTSTYVGPPGATGGTAQGFLTFASPDVAHLMWITFNATIDPLDADPVASAVTANQFSDLYRADPGGVFSHVNRGSLDVPAVAETVSFLGGSAGLDKVIFASNRKLVPDAPTSGAIYQRDGQITRLVNKDETGTPIGIEQLSVRTSGDGSVVAFLTTNRDVLYVWSDRFDQTAKAVGPIVLPGQSDLTVDWLSTDGRKIVFTTAASLNAKDTDTSTDLYEYDTVTHEVALLSAPSGGGVQGNSDACSGSLPGLDKCSVAPVTEVGDGSQVYFVSPEQIVPGRGADGGTNLYLSTHGEIRFVATLDPSDPVYGRGIRERQVRATPDGRKLVFESRAALTGYDNAGHVQVYLYDTDTDALMCASCRTNGTPPIGDSSLTSGPSVVFNGPSMSPANADEHGDRIFFNSLDAIVPKDTNGRSDVYQYTLATGTPALISSGTSERDSAYLGNGVDGRDVFFLTTDTLVPQDRNGNVYKLYDARVGGGVPMSSVPPACQGASCHPDEAPPQPASQGTGRISLRAPRRQQPAIASRLIVSGSRSVRGTSLRLVAKVSGPGRLSVTGRGLLGSSRTASRAASYRLTVHLSKASVTRLRHAKRLRLSATVKFVPRTAAARSVKVRLLFTAPSNRHAR